MIHDPLQRRYGYGVARLRIGLPIGSHSLSQTARTSVDHESRFAALPSLLCGGIALLLFTAAGIKPDQPMPNDPIALAETRPNEIELWSESTTIEAVETVLPIAGIPPVIEPAKQSHLDAVEIEPEAPALALALTSTRRPKFDLALVTIRPAEKRTPDDHITPTPTANIAVRRPTTARVVSAPADLAIADLAQRATSAAAEHLAFGLQTEVPTTIRPGVVRPVALASSLAANAHPTWSVVSERQAFLAAGEAMNKRSPIAPAVDRLPPVALARQSGATAETIRRAFGQVGPTAGWQEVPLDELPDCNPPGRQDMLKKRILLAASVERQCSHRDGSYRFVETRNLGSFLMWSRFNPEHSTGHPVIRDACVVLEKALRCLDESSTEESTQ